MGIVPKLTDPSTSQFSAEFSGNTVNACMLEGPPDVRRCLAKISFVPELVRDTREKCSKHLQPSHPTLPEPGCEAPVIGPDTTLVYGSCVIGLQTSSW